MIKFELFSMENKSINILGLANKISTFDALNLLTLGFIQIKSIIFTRYYLQKFRCFSKTLLDKKI